MKEIKLTPKAARAIRQQLRMFKKKFGREPGPNDPLFFDPDFDVPIRLSEEKFEAEFMIAARKSSLSEEQISRLCLRFGIEYEKYRADA